MQLTEHFSLQEMVLSQTAIRKGIDNTPDERQKTNLVRVCSVLEMIRATIGKPIMVSSGYRCEALNTAIGGSKTSKHMDGLAVDFHVNDMTPKEIIDAVKGVIPFATMIDEFGRWVHLDIDEGRVLRAHKNNGVTQYVAVH